MITSLAKILRKMRIDNDETLKDMADKLKISSAYLSAIENGKRAIPESFYDSLIKEYKINDSKELEEISNAIMLSNKEVSINLDEMDNNQQEISMMFARSIKDCDPKVLEKMKKLLAEAQKDKDESKD